MCVFFSTSCLRYHQGFMSTRLSNRKDCSTLVFFPFSPYKPVPAHLRYPPVRNEPMLLAVKVTFPSCSTPAARLLLAGNSNYWLTCTDAQLSSQPHTSVVSLTHVWLNSGLTAPAWQTRVLEEPGFRALVSRSSA